MSSRQLYRRAGETIRMPVDSAQVIEAGDAVFNNTDDARPASAFTWDTNLAITGANFAAKFLGVASEASPAGATKQITIRRRGVFEFDCASATFEQGDLVGMDDNSGPTALEDQKVIAVGEEGFHAIGRAHKRYGSATTRVEVEIFQPSINPQPMIIPLGTHILSTSDELVTDLDLGFPVKLVSLNVLVTTVMTGAAAEVLTLDKNAQVLDDSLTMGIAAAVGAIVSQALVDATGDDIILAGDTITLHTDGGSDSGSGYIWLVVKPFQMQIA